MGEDSTDNVDTGFTLRSLFDIGIVILAIIVLVSILMQIATSQTDLSVYQVSNVIAAYGTIILSAVLAYLYTQMWSTQEERTIIQENQEDILEEQTKIQKRQQDLLETEKSAILDLSTCDADSDRCFIEVSNHGNGAIKQAVIRTRIQPDSEEITGEWKATQLKKYDGGITGAKVIGADEIGVLMCCNPKFSVSSEQDEITEKFSDITSFINRFDNSGVTLEIEVEAIDEYDNIISSTIVDSNIDVYNNMEFDEIEAWKIN